MEVPHYGWESDSSGDGSESDADGPGTVPSAKRAGDSLIETLIMLYMGSELSARTFCVLTWYAYHAGVSAAKKYAKSPYDKNTGNYQRHLDTALSWPDLHFYHLSMPTTTARAVVRDMKTIPVVNPHEWLNDSVSEASSKKLDELVARRELPPSYFEHPVVKANAGGVRKIYPTAIYMDGVPYTEKDSVIGIWIINLVSQARVLCAAIRKSSVCKCSCKGWCSFFHIFCWLAWCFRAAADGVFPDRRHDSCPWRDNDRDREARAGSYLSARFINIWIKTDWSENVTSLGLAAWSDGLRPCPFCVAYLDDMYKIAGAGPMNLPWECTTDRGYEEACQRCEVRVLINAETHVAVAASLKPDFRSKGSAGLCLVRDFPALGLLKGDRLEPSTDTPDIFAFSAIKSFPAWATFWRKHRRACATATRCSL